MIDEGEESQTRMSSVDVVFAAQSVAVTTRRAHSACAGRKRGICGHEQWCLLRKTPERREGEEKKTTTRGTHKKKTGKRRKKKPSHSLTCTDRVIDCRFCFHFFFPPFPFFPLHFLTDKPWVQRRREDRMHLVACAMDSLASSVCIHLFPDLTFISFLFSLF